MDAVEALKLAFESLEESGHDPRAPMMKALSAMITDNSLVPSGNAVVLTATMAQGGVFTVHDQDGRKVEGVKSVYCFKERDGQDVLQINL